MKAKLVVVFIVLAAMMALTAATPALADNTKSWHDTQVNEWVYDGPYGHYNVKEVSHINGYSAELKNGIYKYDIHIIYELVAFGEGAYGNRIVQHSQYKRVDNQQVGNGGVFSITRIESFRTPLGDSRYQIVFTFANGEVRADMQKMP